MNSIKFNEEKDYDIIEEKIIDAHSDMCILRRVPRNLALFCNSKHLSTMFIYAFCKRNFFFLAIFVFLYFSFCGFFVNQLNKANVCILFGEYVGTVKNGFFL